MAVKQKRIKCAWCGERDDGDEGRVGAGVDLLRPVPR